MCKKVTAVTEIILAYYFYSLPFIMVYLCWYKPVDSVDKLILPVNMLVKMSTVFPFNSCPSTKLVHEYSVKCVVLCSVVVELGNIYMRMRNAPSHSVEWASGQD